MKVKPICPAQCDHRVMQEFGRTIATAAGAFAATNVDAFVLLTVLFAVARAGGTRPWRVVCAQYVVFAALIGASATIATVLAAVPLKWVGLLGFIPLILGIRGLISAHGNHGKEPCITDDFTTIIALTLSVCFDNLSVYVVLLRAQSLADSVVTVGVFALLQALWCGTAYAIASRKRTIDFVRRTGIWLVPVIFVVIGAAIIIRTGLPTEL